MKTPPDDNEFHRSDEREWTDEDIRLGVLSGRGYPLRYLEPGERYALAGIPEVTGVVVSHGSMGSRIRPGSGVKVKQIRNAEGDVVAEFTGKGSVDIISSESMVLPLPPTPE